MKQASALNDVTVLELELDEAGQYCGRLLADLGARVITIEPIGGNPARSIPPYVRDKNGQRRSVPHEYLNRSKESVALDLEDEILASFLREFEAKATVLIHGPRWTDRLPTDLRISTVGAGIYGAGGLKAKAPSSPLTRFQSGGSGTIMPADRPAIPGTLASECFAGAGLAVTVLGLIASSRRSPGSQAPIARADHSYQAHFINLEKMFLGRISKENAKVTRESHRYPFGGAVRCRDGFVSMLINEKHQWRGFCEAIGKPEWATDKRFATGSDRFAMKEDIKAALHPWCAERTRAEVVDVMRTRQVPIGSVNEIGELLEDEVLRARRFLRDEDTPYGRTASMGLPFGADPLWANGVGTHAPLLGQHTNVILSELGWDKLSIDMLESLNLTRNEYVEA